MSWVNITTETNNNELKIKNKLKIKNELKIKNDLKIKNELKGYKSSLDEILKHLLEVIYLTKLSIHLKIVKNIIDHYLQNVVQLKFIIFLKNL